MEQTPKNRPPGAGKSSFELIDRESVFSALGPMKDCTFLDLACGLGYYVLATSELIGPGGQIYAIDLWEEGIDDLRAKISEKGLHNVNAILGDITTNLPIDNHSVDICLIATALHDIVQAGSPDGVFVEIARVLKPLGTLAVIEFKKIDGPPGPPIHVRLSPNEVNTIALRHGFRQKCELEAGTYTYMMLFEYIGSPV